jgi:hypothetical protein
MRLHSEHLFTAIPNLQQHEVHIRHSRFMDPGKSALIISNFLRFLTSSFGDGIEGEFKNRLDDMAQHSYFQNTPTWARNSYHHYNLEALHLAR